MEQYPNETTMHYQHRLQRSESRQKALLKFPKVYVPRIWTDTTNGVTTQQDFGGYKDHPEYQGEYLRQLKIVRARRFQCV